MGNKRPPLRVLSVDFDYFQKLPSRDILYDYPDGVDLPTSITSAIWASHYAFGKTRENLLKVQADKEGLKHLRGLLGKCKGNEAVMVVQSHKHIYDFIMDNYICGGASSVEVYNVDMHHDMFSEKETVDCGNWAYHIKKDIKGSKIYWIAHEFSEEAYGKKPALRGKTYYDLSVLDDKEFDMIFVCRSDSWLPPHLDNEFAKLYKFMRCKFERMMVDNQIQKPRSWKKESNALMKQYAEIRNFKG